MTESLLLAATIPDALTFAIAAAICVGGAFGVVLSRNPVHAALSLVATLFGVAVLFVEEDAQFLAAVQVIVYAGAIVVLFLFVIMLLGVDRQESFLSDKLKAQKPIAVLLGVVVLVEVLLLADSKWSTGAPSVSGKLTGPSTNVSDLGQSIFTTYLLAFEVTSALLVIAVIAAVVLTRRHPEQRAGHSLPDQGSTPEGPGPEADAVLDGHSDLAELDLEAADTADTAGDGHPEALEPDLEEADERSTEEVVRS